MLANRRLLSLFLVEKTILASDVFSPNVLVLGKVPLPVKLMSGCYSNRVITDRGDIVRSRIWGVGKMEAMSEPLILGIESTCDETGVALVRGGKLLADRTATSMDEHARYGGIIPEIASRAHLESFLPTLQAACEEAGVALNEVDAIACAAGPGLVGSLTVGISAAKALALALDKPLYGVNHVIGHLAVDALVEGEFHPPFIGLICSGGHSNLVLVRDLASDITELGGTLDDAAGEAFDKVGRLLNTPYPGGPHVDRLAQAGDKKAIRFPRGLAAGKDKERHRYDFSFSGLKTAVARYIEGLEAAGETINRENICAGFSEAVNDSLTKKAVQAAQDFDCREIVVGGGFSANSRLRELLAQRAEAAGITVRIPPIRFCTVNGAQIAALGEALVKAGMPPSSTDFGPDSQMALTQIYMAPSSEDTEKPAAKTSIPQEKQVDAESIYRKVKENMAKSFDQMRPGLEKAADRIKPLVEQGREYAEETMEKARPYVEQAVEKSRPYMEQAAEKSREYAEETMEKARPYMEQAAEKGREYAEQAVEKGREYAKQAQQRLHERSQAKKSDPDEPSVTVEPPDDVEPRR